MRKKIGIMGGGVWGSALSKLLSNNDVLIYARDQEIVSSINKSKINPKLKYVIFNDNVKATTKILELHECDYLFFALPVQQLREVCNLYGNCNEKQKIIIGSKGIDIESGLLPYEIIKPILNTENISILSGPCFSHEVAQNLPTAVTFATKNIKIFEEVNNLFSQKSFRLYFSDDLIGCQLGGSLKNIYAIAVGITIGLNLGENSKSALIARSFVEIMRFAKTMGAKTNTLYGLSGLGDLILTCNSLHSRNTSFGQQIASHQNTPITDHLKSRGTTEGYFTVQAVQKIAKDKKINMPIVESVYRVLFNGSLIQEEINNLLNRPITNEFVD